jgi:glycosyltransferase involved in cell wall biosynthesis
VIELLSSRIIVMGSFIAETFSHHRRTAKVVKVYDGLDLRDFHQPADGKTLRTLLHIQDDEFLVGLIASINASWKKHEIFIQMAALLKETLPKVRFVHFGHIPSPSTHHWKRYDTLCRMIEELDLKDHFIWAGVVADIPQMMDALDVLVHPCDTEPFGRVAIEAMAAGKPVVGPARGGIAESVVNGQTGFLVEPGNPEAFAKAAEYLLVNPGLRREMGCAGRARVEAHFSIQYHVMNMIEVFDEVLR